VERSLEILPFLTGGAKTFLGIIFFKGWHGYLLMFGKGDNIE
jgi:hypothetical protein